MEFKCELPKLGKDGVEWEAIVFVDDTGGDDDDDECGNCSVE